MSSDTILTGRFYGADGYDLRCLMDDDKIQGRVGGRLAGKEIALEITDTGVVGTVGSLLVDVSLRNGELKGKVADQDIVIRGVDRVTGRLGSAITGWEVMAQQVGQKLVGRLGTSVRGKDFDMELQDAPGWIGALVALVAFYAFEKSA